MLQRDNLLSLLSELSQIFQWIWDGDPQPFVAPTSYYPEAVGAIGYVSLTAAAVVGVDENRNEMNDAEELENDSYGVRVYTFSIRFESFSSNVAPYDVAEQTRTRIRRASSRAVLTAMGLSIQTIGTLNKLDYDEDNRRIFATGFDLICNRLVTGNESAPGRSSFPSEKGTWIETVNGDNRIPYVPPT